MKNNMPEKGDELGKVYADIMEQLRAQPRFAHCTDAELFQLVEDIREMTLLLIELLKAEDVAG